MEMSDQTGDLDVITGVTKRGWREAVRMYMNTSDADEHVFLPNTRYPSYPHTHMNPNRIVGINY